VAAGINGQSGDLELVVLALGFPSQLDDERLEEVGRLLVSVARDVMAEAGVSSASVPSA
jgi:DNA-binding IclR family transcriptional regulator